MEKKKIETFFDLESECERKFNENGPFWHVYTPGELTDTLFLDKKDFSYGVSLFGQCDDKFSLLRTLTFTLLNNHQHSIMGGEKQDCIDFIALYKKRLKRYFDGIGRRVNLDNFEVEPLPIDSLRSLRNEIVYVNRNGYLINQAHTPFSYPWGTSCYFFNAKHRNKPSVPYSSLSRRRQREICKSGEIELSDRIRVVDDMLDPLSFTHIDEAQSYFRNAHQYFNLLSKNYEAFSEIGKTMKDSVFISDEEMYSMVCYFAIQKFNVKNPSMLSATAKIEMAKMMHYDYNASNKQIKRILKLDISIIDTLFPHSK